MTLTEGLLLRKEVLDGRRACEVAINLFPRGKKSRSFEVKSMYAFFDVLVKKKRTEFTMLVEKWLQSLNC